MPTTSKITLKGMADDAVGVDELSATGTASSSTFLRGDNAWAAAGEITKSSSDPTVSTNPSGGVGTVWANTTSGEMFVCTNATAGSNIWVNVGEGAGGVPAYMTHTGGSEATDGDYKVVTFTASGTFTPTVGMDPTYGDKVEYLVIAGGGGAGDFGGGGGGAGGYRTDTSFAVTNTGLTVTIGAGGTAGDGAGETTNGLDSVFSSRTSTGGGRGGANIVSGTNHIGQDGGSGGGGSNRVAGFGSGNTPSTSPSQGNNGAAGYTPGPYAGGGGGGATAVGTAASSGGGGNGGNGTSSSITGSAVTRGGGGAGGAASNASGGSAGTGGGGIAGVSNGDGGPGGTNTGGGGGGGHSVNTSTAGSGGAGGSGLVILRYKFQ